MFHEIIKKPLITEKTIKLAETENKYSFLVNPKVNKIEIAKAIAKHFKVVVLDVNVVNYIGKVVAFGKRRLKGRKKSYKKAVVTLKQGDTLQDFSIK